MDGRVEKRDFEVRLGLNIAIPEKAGRNRESDLKSKMPCRNFRKKT